MVHARFELDDYTIRVLDVVKGKFGLKNRNEALKQLVLEKGSEFVEPIPREEALKELDMIYEDHIKKHGTKTISLKELDTLLGIDD